MKKGLILFSLLFLLGLKSATAQESVKGILFYMPTCPHCHIVMEEVLPPLQAQYGEQLQILLVNASQPEAQKYFAQMCQAYAAPSCGGVPMLFIGDTYLIGSYDIPTYLPAIIESGLQNGGIPAPQGFEALFGENQTTEVTPQKQGFSQLAGYSLALVVLGLLCASLIIGGMIYQHTLILPLVYENYILLGLSLLSLLIAGTLLLELEGLSWAAILAFSLTLGLGILFGLIWNHAPVGNIFPLVLLLGILVAAYMAHVELRQTEAICGVVGDCNTVQQSDYAHLFGVLPIGVLGLLGYALIGSSWWVGQKFQHASASQMALALTALGAVFSVYLTFLEVFVIKAVCAWCLSSAMLMLLLLWLQLPTPKLVALRIR